MATTGSFNTEEEFLPTLSGEPTDQLTPDEDLDDDLDPQEAETDDEEPYEGIRHGEDEDEGMVDDNMTGMPVVPSPS